MLLLEVAGAIRSRLGEPTVSALATRFGPAGRCLTCGVSLGAAPLSVRAYSGDTGIVTLLAYHAQCATSAWLDVGSALLPGGETWAAAMASTAVWAGDRRPFRRLRGSGQQGPALPLLLVHPSLETARVRPVGAGDAVNADLEEYCRLGFTDPGAPSRARRLPQAGPAWKVRIGGRPGVSVRVGRRAWSAPVRQPHVAELLTSCDGVLIGITCDRDPAGLSADAGLLDNAISYGEVLLGWAPWSATAMAGSQDAGAGFFPPAW